jgi:hypothetical protein
MSEIVASSAHQDGIGTHAQMVVEGDKSWKNMACW